jgi:hypothetical protein
MKNSIYSENRKIRDLEKQMRIHTVSNKAVLSVIESNSKMINRNEATIAKLHQSLANVNKSMQDIRIQTSSAAYTADTYKDATLDQAAIETDEKLELLKFNFNLKFDNLNNELKKNKTIFNVIIVVQFVTIIVICLLAK